MLDTFLSLLQGAGITIVLAIGGNAFALAVAFAAGLLRLSSIGPIRWAAAVFVEFFRGTSLLVQLFILFYLLPLTGIILPPIQTGIVALGLNFGSYGSEIVRGAIRAVDPGQAEAAESLGMAPRTTMWRIILPQAFIAMLPPFANSAVQLLKGTSLASLITIQDLTLHGQILVSRGASTTLVYSLLLGIYFAMCFPLARLVRYLETRRRYGMGLGRNR